MHLFNGEWVARGRAGIGHCRSDGRAKVVFDHQDVATIGVGQIQQGVFVERNRIEIDQSGIDAGFVQQIDGSVALVHHVPRGDNQKVSAFGQNFEQPKIEHRVVVVEVLHVRAVGAQEAWSVVFGHGHGQAVRGVGVRRLKQPTQWLAIFRLGGGEASEPRHIGKRHLTWTVSRQGDSRVGANNFDVGSRNDGHLDLVIRAGQELREGGTEGHLLSGGQSCRHRDHVLLGDLAFGKPVGCFGFGQEVLGEGGVPGVSIQRPNSLVVSGQHAKRHAECFSGGELSTFQHQAFVDAVHGFGQSGHVFWAKLLFGSRCRWFDPKDRVARDRAGELHGGQAQFFTDLLELGSRGHFAVPALTLQARCTPAFDSPGHDGHGLFGAGLEAVDRLHDGRRVVSVDVQHREPNRLQLGHHALG